jgi:hypothetical protein
MVIETERVLIVKGRTETDGWCSGCAAPVKLVSPEHAAALTGLTRREVYRLIESCEVHFSESEALVSVCLASLTAATSSLTASSLSIKLRRLS